MNDKYQDFYYSIRSFTSASDMKLIKELIKTIFKSEKEIKELRDSVSKLEETIQSMKY